MAFENTTKAKSLLAYHRILSPSASIKVSPICLRTMNFGEAWKAVMGECNKETTFQILDHFYNNGGNFIDTANMYMNGESEIWLGEWMNLRQNRNEMVIVTTYTSPVQTLSTNPSNAILSNEGGNNKKSLRISLETSLKNLKTDYVDVLYVHAWEGLTSIPELMRALDDVVRTGKVLYLGVSNWPAWIVVKANEYARQHCLTPFVVYEGRWNPAEREIKREILPMCQTEEMGITVWGALGAGKFKSKEQKDDGVGRRSIRDFGGASLESFERFAVVMGEIGKRKGTDAIAVALRYVMLKAPYVFPIVGGRTVQHLKHNIEALELDLSEDDIEEIESAVPFDFGYPHSFLSGNRSKQISSSNPASFLHLYCFFDGVEDAKPIRTKH